MAGVRGVGRSWGKVMGSPGVLLRRTLHVSQSTIAREQDPQGSCARGGSHQPPWIPPAPRHLVPPRAEQADAKPHSESVSFQTLNVSSKTLVVFMTMLVLCCKTIRSWKLGHKSGHGFIYVFKTFINQQFLEASAGS